MLIGDLVVLRAREAADVPVLHRELHGDVVTRSRADNRPWQPSGTDHSPYAAQPPTPDSAVFSLVEKTTDELAGEALLWDIDLHNRSAHIGVSVRPSMRRRGLAEDSVRVLCRYGFETRGLHRLQIDTLADNGPMRRVAEKLGFRHEGTMVASSWVNGTFLDDVVYGLLAEEWLQQQA